MEFLQRKLIFLTSICTIASVIPIMKYSIFRRPPKGKYHQRLYGVNHQRGLKKFPFETISIQDIAKRHPRHKQRTVAKHISGFNELFLNRYTDFHKTERVKCETSTEYRNISRVLVYGGVHSVGLGDRIRGILFSLIIASFTNRILLLNTSESFPLEKVLGNKAGTNFSYDPEIFPINLMGSKDVVHSSTFHRIEQYDDISRVIISNATDSFDISLLLTFARSNEITRCKLIEAGLPHLTLHRADIAPFVLNSIFEPTDLLRRRVRDRMQRYRQLHSMPYLGVHARFGYGIGESNDRFNLSKIGMNFQSAALCFGRAAGRHALKFGMTTLFLSTDTRKLNIPISLGIHEVYPDASIYHARGKAVHTGTGKLLYNNRESFHGFMRAFVDLSILGNAQKIVSLKSGFADVAVWMGAITDAVTVDLRSCPEATLSKRNFI